MNVMSRFGVWLICLGVLAGCGYRVVQQPAWSVYLVPVQNRTDRPGLGAAVERAVRHRLEARGFRLARNREGADRVLTVTLASGDVRTLQSGRDARVTLQRERIALLVRLTGDGTEENRSASFSLLDRFPVTADRYVDDRSRTDREMADRMALQVVAWLLSR